MYGGLFKIQFSLAIASHDMSKCSMHCQIQLFHFPRPLSIPPHPLSPTKNPPLLRRRHSLRIIKHLIRIQRPLNLLQPRQILLIIQTRRLGPIQLRIRIIHIHAPLLGLQVVRKRLDPAIQQTKPVGRVRPRAHAVVQLVQEDLVAEGVGSRAVGGAVGDGRVLAAVGVDDDEPVAVVLARRVLPVVADGLEGGGGEGRGDEGFGVECLDLWVG